MAESNVSVDAGLPELDLDLNGPREKENKKEKETSVRPSKKRKPPGVCDSESSSFVRRKDDAKSIKQAPRK